MTGIFIYKKGIYNCYFLSNFDAVFFFELIATRAHGNMSMDFLYLLLRFWLDLSLKQPIISFKSILFHKKAKLIHGQHLHFLISNVIYIPMIGIDSRISLCKLIYCCRWAGKNNKRRNSRGREESKGRSREEEKGRGTGQSWSRC